MVIGLYCVKARQKSQPKSEVEQCGCYEEDISQKGWKYFASLWIAQLYLSKIPMLYEIYKKSVILDLFHPCGLFFHL